MISFDLANELFEYSATDGVLMWKNHPSQHHLSGKRITGTDTCGYVRARYLDKCLRAHRVIWLLVNGSLPDLDIDHMNGNRTDNRIQNLRLATRAENLQNRLKPRMGAKSGLIGASFHKDTGKWAAVIMRNYKRYDLGLFKTAEEAHVAYMDKKRELHSFFSR